MSVSRMSVSREEFLDKIVALCREHGAWLAHEDSCGTFLIVDDDTSNWLLRAVDERDGERLARRHINQKKC